MGLVESLIIGKDGALRGAVVRVSKTRRETSRPVNKLYPIESIKNKRKEMNDASEATVTRNRPRREAAVIGDIKRRFVAGSVKVYILPCNVKDNFSMMRN